MRGSRRSARATAIRSALVAEPESSSTCRASSRAGARSEESKRRTAGAAARPTCSPSNLSRAGRQTAGNASESSSSANAEIAPSSSARGSCFTAAAKSANAGPSWPSACSALPRTICTSASWARGESASRSSSTRAARGSRDSSSASARAKGSFPMPEETCSPAAAAMSRSAAAAQTIRLRAKSSADSVAILSRTARAGLGSLPSRARARPP